MLERHGFTDSGRALGASSRTEPKIEARSVRDPVVDRYAGAMRPDDLHNDRQAQSGSAGANPLAAPEALEDVRPILRRNARAAILDTDRPLRVDLDDDNSRKVAELLSRACRERGKTLILVTHDRQMIRPVDRVFDMRDGSLTMIESVLVS